MNNILCNSCKNYDFCYDRDFPNNGKCKHYRNESISENSEAADFLNQLSFEDLKEAARILFRFMPNLIVYEMDDGVYASRVNSAVVILHANDLQDAKAKISEYLSKGGAI